MHRIDRERVAWSGAALGEVMVLELDSGKLCGLNDVGSFIWSLIENHTLEEIGRMVSEAFDVDQRQAVEDAAVFLREMERRGYVRSAA